MKSLFLLPFIFFSFIANATNYYISSTSGNDSNAGTSTDLPWKTLAKLNAAFSSLRHGDSILLKRGDSFYGSITITRSGTPGSPIIIGAYGTGSNPIITGFTTVGAWTNSGGNIWESTNAVSALSATKMVVINGVNVGMGRYPNTGYITYESFSGNTSITSSSLNSAVTNWAGAQVLFFANSYSFSKGLITAHSGATLAFTPDPKVLFYNHHDAPVFFIQNDRRTLDTANEWYYNPSTKKLLVYELSSPVNVQIATIDTLVYIHNHDYITFDNISFQGANTSAMEANKAKHITVRNCSFNFSGVSAIHGMHNAFLTGIDIENSAFNNSNNEAIDIDKSDSAVIRYNVIKNSGVIPGMGNVGSEGHFIALTSLGTNTLIEYNVIDSAGYCGINFYGNNTIVQNNYVKNTCLLLGEGGGIYTFDGEPGPTQFGIKVRNNICINKFPSSLYYHGNTGYSYGLYFDGYSNNMEVSGNSESGSAWGMMFHDTWSMNIHDNTMYNNSKNSIVFRGDDTMKMPYMNVKHNIFFAKNANDYTLWFEPPAVDPGGLLPHMTSDSNYWARPIDNNGTSFLIFQGHSHTKKNLAGWQAFSGQDMHSKTTPKIITDVNDLRFEYNATSSPLTISLGSSYIDVKNISYHGTITLAPYTSVVLMKDER